MNSGMKATRAAPMLLVGFGLLIGLIGLTGLGALQRARQCVSRYLGAQRAVRADGARAERRRDGIYVVGLLARDYLLDPSNAHAADYRAQLIAERSSIEE